MPIRFVEIDGLKVRYSDEGQGPNLLFLHGWGAGFEAYKPLLGRLAEHHRVVAPDLPGAGASQEPAAPWDAADYVRFAQALAARIGLTEAVLIGHSHGGRIILKWMGAPPAPGAPRVDSVVLFAAAGLRPRRGPAYYARVYAYKAAKWLLRPWPRALERLRSRAGSADYRAASPVMRGTLSKLLAEDMAPLLPRIGVPALLIWGDADTATPLADAERMKARIPDAGLVVLSGADHWACVREAARCHRIVTVFVRDTTTDNNGSDHR
ncbi:MAG: alpha/beta hydrolase [Oscillospiraceae bacterium]|nr:alpha/beta hydrolase [Oscillospiraceae bacterium]